MYNFAIMLFMSREHFTGIEYDPNPKRHARRVGALGLVAAVLAGGYVAKQHIELTSETFCGGDDEIITTDVADGIDVIGVDDFAERHAPEQNPRAFMSRFHELNPEVASDDRGGLYAGDTYVIPKCLPEIE
jgi:hypothetical protein